MTNRSIVALCAALMTGASLVARQPEPPQPVRLTRADMADVYLRFERALREHPPKGEEAAAINQAFDRATLQFFSGTYGDSIKVLSETTDRLNFGDAVTSNHVFASSMKVTVVPAVLRLDEPTPVVIRVEPLYKAQPVGAVTIRIISADGRVAFNKAITEPREMIPVDPKLFVPGTYRVQVVSGDESLFSTRFVVSDRSLNTVRDELLKKLEPAPGGSAAIEQAIVACRARINLLSDSPAPENSSQFLSDPTALRVQIGAEIDAILGGKDPYHDRRGDYWRTVAFKGAEIPCRIYAPASLPEADIPVLIALHGAGGDEAMFMDGYGAGLLKQIAEKRGFLLISPRTEVLIGNALALDQVIAAAGYCYDIDRSRVYLLGHSLGAMASGSLSAQRPDAIAAACLIAGTGRFSKGKPVPPTLVIGGELDPLMRAEQVKAGVKQGTDAGLPVELRMIPGRGHTLVVGEQLEAAVDWLLKHKR
jgi:predicted esterase